jgi:nicotinamide mononucleotide transporter
MRRPLTILGYTVAALFSLGLVVGVATNRLGFGWLDTIGFLTGVWGVWWQVRENVWNWPIQLVSSAVYVVVFFQARLFADTMINVIEIGLYISGWYWWLRGGNDHTELHIDRTSLRLAAAMTVVGVAATGLLTVLLDAVRDAAPFLDALTSVMSIIALFMTGRKLFEVWWVWIVVNVIYVGMYEYKALPLTAVLYAFFAVFSVAGLLNWRRLLSAQRARAEAA